MKVHIADTNMVEAVIDQATVDKKFPSDYVKQNKITSYNELYSVDHSKR